MNELDAWRITAIIATVAFVASVLGAVGLAQVIDQERDRLTSCQMLLEAELSAKVKP